MEIINDAVKAILQALSQTLEWFWELVTFLPKLLWEYLGDAVITYVEEIPVPDWMTNASLGSAITPEMAYFMEGFALSEGLAIIGSALLLRFLIRRTPIIG